jgi:glycerol kinase
MTETTALGAAMAAGSADGVQVWDLTNLQAVGNDTFRPAISEDGKFIHNESYYVKVKVKLSLYLTN